MDDSLDSVKTVCSEIHLYQHLSNLSSKAGMQSRKYFSNSSKVLEKIPEQDRAVEIDLNRKELPATKTLRVLSVASNDVFLFKGANQINETSLPKRIFDTLSFL